MQWNNLKQQPIIISWFFKSKILAGLTGFFDQLGSHKRVTSLDLYLETCENTPLLSSLEFLAESISW